MTERQPVPGRYSEVQPDTSAGFIEYQARRCFRDLQAIYGFAGAREIMAEIINHEADRAGRYSDAA